MEYASLRGTNSGVCLPKVYLYGCVSSLRCTSLGVYPLVYMQGMYSLVYMQGMYSLVYTSPIPPWVHPLPTPATALPDTEVPLRRVSHARPWGYITNS